MIKAVCLMRRRAGMSADEFRDYYESHHAKIGEAVFPGRAHKYVRRYLKPFASEADFGHSAAPLQFDVIMEVWYNDDAKMAESFEILASERARAFAQADEVKLFDPDGVFVYFVDERESDLSAPKRDRSGAERFLGIG